jgi:uncharacterized protein
MKHIKLIAAILVILGAIDWGFIGLFDFDIIGYLFSWFFLDRIVYVLIGIAGVYQLIHLFLKKR